MLCFILNIKALATMEKVNDNIFHKCNYVINFSNLNTMIYTLLIIFTFFIIVFEDYFAI